MQLNIKTLFNKIITIRVNSNESILHLKSKIQDVEGIHPDVQYLFFNNEKLDDNKNIIDYKINDNSTIYLSLNSERLVYN
jgi:hypothetical protein